MKIFLSFLILFSCSLSLAEPMFLSESDWADRKLGNRGHTFYVSKDKCELVNAPDKCYNPTDVKREKLGVVDDLSKPILRAPKNSPVLLDCLNFNDCGPKSTNVCLADGGLEKWDELTNHPDVTGLTGPWFIWCEKGTGSFVQKPGIVADAAGIIADDLAKQKKIDDDIIRTDKRGDRDVELGACIQETKSGVLTLPRLNECFRAHLRETRGDKVDPTDL